MGSWSGWETDLLKAGGFDPGGYGFGFIDGWHDHANSDCGANPVDISFPEPHATRCKNLPGGRNAKAYVSHPSAARAFASQVNSGAFPHLVTVLEGAGPLTAAQAPAVIDELVQWGSLDFAQYLAQHYNVPPPGSGAGGPTHFHKGWDDLRRSVNHHYPNALTDQSKLTTAALRKLAHARKVL